MRTDQGSHDIVPPSFSPFPFNISNLFFASLQSVSLANFMMATMTTTPKLMLHVFIGNRLFQLFDRGARAGLDTSAKILNGVYVVVGEWPHRHGGQIGANRRCPTPARRLGRCGYVLLRLQRDKPDPVRLRAGGGR